MNRFNILDLGLALSQEKKGLSRREDGVGGSTNDGCVNSTDCSGTTNTNKCQNSHICLSP